MWQVGDFELGPCIGVGQFGRIVVARERQSKAVIVLKSVKKRRIDRMKVQRQIAREIEIQGHLKHPNILQLFGFFWDRSSIYLILEHASNGDLGQLLKKQPGQRFEESTAAAYVAQTMSAIEYCHRMHIIHRDLKPQNLLIGQSNQVKLADFGWAVHTYPDQQRWTLCGTLDYLPPEIVHAVKGHSFGVDVWGLGVLTFELLEGQAPFAAPTCEETYRRILAASPTFPSVESADGNRVSPKAVSFILSLLKKDPSDRPALAVSLQDPWLSEFSQGCGTERPSHAAHAGA